MEEKSKSFKNGLSDIISKYSKLLEGKLSIAIDESKEQPVLKLGNHIDLKSHEKLKKVNELYPAFLNNYVNDDKIDKILELWGSGQKADFSLLDDKYKSTENPRLINSVSNKIRLQVCLKKDKQNTKGLKELAGQIHDAINKIKIEDNVKGKSWDDLIVKGKINLENKDAYLNNDIQAFLKELYYCVHYEDDNYPLWNGCTKNALDYICEIEYSKSSPAPNSKEEIVKSVVESFSDKVKNQKNYKLFFLIDQLFNLFDKITQTDVKKGTEVNDIHEFYQNVWNYLMKSPSWRKRRLKASMDLLNIFKSNEGANIILYGPPGTSKTYGVEETIKEFLKQEIEDDDDEFEKLDDEVLKLYKERVKLIQFHPSYDYEDFIEGYKIKQGDKKQIYFEKTSGHFKSFIENIKNENGNFKYKYFFIIDEINRADLAKVLGELMYCLEKRGNKMSMRYSTDEEFTIPPNVFIIGTMNTTDKSVESFDIALRRRFIWLYRDYDEEILKGMLQATGISYENGNGKNLLEFAKNLNNKISNNPNLGENYKIGQAIFQKAIDGKKINTKEFEDFHLKPLLKEYLRFSEENEINLNIQVENLIKESKPKKQESEN